MKPGPNPALCSGGANVEEINQTTSYHQAIVTPEEAYRLSILPENNPSKPSRLANPMSSRSRSIKNNCLMVKYIEKNSTRKMEK